MKSLLVLASAALLGAAGPPVFAWRDGAVYQVQTEPGRVTDIALEPGETLSPTGAVAAGDTVRWIIGESRSGQGADAQTHVLVKPVAAGLSTNLVLSTDRRVYHVELRSSPTGYMAQVAWRYPQGELIALEGAAAAAAPPSGASLKGKAGAVAPSSATVAPASTTARARCPSSASPAPDLASLHFGYKLEGNAPWRPVRVFDDGRRTVIDFPAGVAAGQMPPLFVLGPKGEDQLVNYRVIGHRIVADGIFQAAELKMGAGKSAAAVRIAREATGG